MTTPTRRRLTALTGTIALGAGLVLATPLVPTALAAPVASATYTAGAGSGIVDLSSLSLVGLNLATAQVGAASATASNAPAASAASAKNLGATLVGLPITVDENAQSAPPDNASPSSRGLNAVNIPALLSTGVLDTSVQARTATGATCLGDGAALSTSTVGTAGVTVAPGLVPGVIPSLAQVNAVSVASRTSLVAAAGASDTRAVQASSAAQLAGVDILGSNGISVTVAGTPTLTATASGQTATSGVALTGVDPSTVTVKVAGRAVPVNATGVTTIPLDLRVLGTGILATVDLTLGKVTGATNTGTSVSGSAVVVQLDVKADTYVAGIKAASLASVSLGVAPLSASATAPADGVQCAPQAATAPVISSPTTGALLGTATPAITGTGTPGATVTVTEGGATVCTATVTAGGTWSCTPATPLAEGAHTVSATQVLPGGLPGPASNSVTFTVDTVAPAAPTLITPGDGAQVVDTTPTVSGTGEPGATVTVTEGGTTLCTAVVSTGGTWSCEPTTPLGLGSHTISATQTDPAGNTSPATTRTFTIVAPAAGAPVITTPLTGALVADTTPTITGTGTVGATVTVVEGGTTLCTTTVGLSGTWTCDATTLGQGPHTVTATQVPLGGSTSAVSNAVTFTVDTVADAAPVITAPANGSTTRDTTPAIRGTGATGSTVTVREGTTVLCTAIVAAGTWTCDAAPALADGPHTVTATQTDAAGNVSVPSAAVTFTIDATADAAPVITTPTSGSTTNDNTPTISGTGVTGSTVTVREGTTVLCTVPVTNGTWSCTSATLSDGAHTVTATQTDPAGNVSAPSAPVVFTVDTTASAPPTITTPAAGSSDTDTTPTLIGMGVPGDKVTVTEGGTTLCSGITVSPAGVWTCTSATLAVGPHTITATQTDPAGNTSAASAPVSFTVLDAASAAPVITSPTGGQSTGDNTPLISGTGVEDAIVSVTEGGVELCTAQVSGGTWSCTSSTLLDGPHTITATQTAPGAATSSASAPVSFTVDTVAPVTPVIIVPAAGAQLTDTTPTISGTAEPGSAVTVSEGSRVLCQVVANATTGAWSCDSAVLALGAHTVSAVSADAAGNTSPAATRSFSVVLPAAGAPVISTPTTGTLTNDTSPTISGTGVPLATVTVKEGATVVCTATVTALGTWTCDASPALAEGPHTVSATQVGTGLGTSPASNTVTFTIDTTADAAPVITAPTQGALTKDSTPTISGTGVSGSTVTVTENGITVCTALVASGTWTCDASPALGDGPHTVVATQTDPAGNASAPSNLRSFTIDTKAPVAPVITAPLTGTTTNDNTPTVTGTGEPGATVIISVDGTPVCTTTVSATATFTCTLTTPLPDGPHVITATQRDPAGNTGPASTPVSITVDTTAPAAPVITTPADGSAVQAGLVTFTGTGEPAATVVVRENGQELCRAVVTGGGSWSCTTTGAIAVGAHTVTATQTDVAGNTSGPATTRFTIELGGTQYVPSGPTRVLDTRLGGGAPVSAGTTVRLTAAQLGLTPGSASAVALNVTVDAPQTDGFLSLYPDGQTRPTVSSLNFRPGQTVANLVIVPVGPDGGVTIYAQRTTHVVADLFGYFSTTQLDPTGGLYHSLQPQRLEDTRFAAGSSTVPSTTRALGTNGLITVQATGRGGVPTTGVSAVAVNITVSRPTDSGYVSAFPSNQGFSGTSNLNFVAGDLASTRAIVPVGPDGAVTFYNRVGRTDLVVDVTGYFSSDASGDTTGAQFVAVDPQRVADSRDNLGAFGKLGGNQSQNLAVTDVAGVPTAGTTAVVANVTAVSPSEDGFFTVYPAGTQRPLSSDVNFRGGEVVPNLTLAGVGTGGRISLYNLNGTADAVVDVTGYFTTTPPVIGAPS